jgi:hypothetical protein
MVIQAAEDAVLRQLRTAYGSSSGAVDSQPGRLRPVHDEEGWEAREVGFENLSEEELDQGHWHAW